jgi:hypothetical protein
MEEPHEMVSDDEDARGDEGGRSKGNDGPCIREILEIDDVAEYGEHDLVQRKRICECQREVYRNDDLALMLIPERCDVTTRVKNPTYVYASLSKHLGKLGVLFDQF